MHSSSRVSRFDRISQLLWAVLVLTLVSVSILTQVTSRGSQAAVPISVGDPDRSNELPTVNYAGVEWSIESSRLSPASAEGVITVIVEMQALNKMTNVPQTMHASGVKLVSDLGETIELDRFANNNSRQYVHLSPGQTKSMTFAFKANHSNFDFDEWEIIFAETERHTPATLPLTGSVEPVAVELEFSEAELVQSISNAELTPGRVAALPNHGSRRSLLGRTFLHVEISVDGNLPTQQLDRKQAWQIETDLEEATAVSVSSARRNGKTVFNAVFDVEVKATTAELRVGTSNGQRVSFNVVTRQLG